MEVLQSAHTATGFNLSVWLQSRHPLALQEQCQQEFPKLTD